MCKCDTDFYIMPSNRKRIGFLPREEIHSIIEKLCLENKISQSKVTGILVEEALSIRAIINNSRLLNEEDLNDLGIKRNAIFKSVDRPTTLNKDFSYKNNQNISEDIKMINEFIEYKIFKKIISQNNNLID